MNNYIHISILMVCAVVGFLAAMLVPIYSMPFGGCAGSSILSIDPHCGVWPEVLRNVLLVLPSAFFIRSKPFLIGYIIAVLVLASMGGLLGLNSGRHFDMFKQPGPIMYNIYHQILPSLCSMAILLAGYFLNQRGKLRAV